MRLPTRNAPIPSKICEKACFYQYFKACLGALDGMHIPVPLPRNNKPHIEIARANYCKMCSQLVTLTSGLSMCSLDWKGALQTAMSLSMQRWKTLSFLRDNITWVMLGIPTWHHSLFLIRTLVTTLRNGEMVNISMHTFPFTCSQAFSWPPCCS